MNTLAELRVFVRVVEVGGIARAARQLNLAKSALSRRIATLEDRLGGQLLIRGARAVTPTPEGEAFYHRARRILQDLEEAEAGFRAARADLAGVIRIASPVTFGTAVLGPVLLDFQAIHPSVRLEIDFDDRPVDLIAGNFDVALRIGRLADSSLIARRLATIAHVVAAAPHYLARAGTPRRPEDLARHVLLRYGNVPTAEVLRYQASDGIGGTVSMPVGMTANNGDFLRAAAVAGRGVIVEPEFVCRPALEDGSLVQVLGEYDWSGMQLHAVYPPARYQTARVRALIDFLATRLST